MTNDLLQDAVTRAVEKIQAWEGSYAPYAPHPAMEVAPEVLFEALDRYTEKLQGNYPFFHPDYAGQMLKPPHPVAVAGYLAAMLINPNNHALDGGPPTAEMEKEVVRKLAAMFHFPGETLGHLTTSGTIANLEALWVARGLHPGKTVVSSEAAHYTHARMCGLLGVAHRAIPTMPDGRMDLDALEAVLRTGEVGTVVATTGTTSLGAVDEVEEIVALATRHDVRVHVDAAYGGFFSILAWADAPEMKPEVARHFRAIAGADSIAVDPHKHGLQPYGCGCVLFRDPAVGRFYRHDSPYTYFTSNELHLGEISLECSRAGAAAGALWLTLDLIPLEAGRGLGPILAACLRAQARWSEAVAASSKLTAYLPRPDLDIATYFPAATSASGIDGASKRLFDRAMQAEAPIFTGLLRVSSERLTGRVPGFVADQPDARVLRSVFLKPEHELRVDSLLARLESLVD